ncbi:hypothetical protein Esti_004559 [Eimeria stiedai]
MLEAYEHKIYSRVRQTGTAILLRLQDGEDPRDLFTASGVPRCPPYPLCCKLHELGELGPAGIPLFFLLIKFLLILSATYGLLSLPVGIAVYSHKMTDASTNCSTFNRVLLTAGCLDDDASRSHLPGVMSLVMVLTTVFSLPVLFWRQEHLKKEAGEQVYQPRDFALLLEGFPPDATCEDEIVRFVCSSLLLNQPPDAVVKVVIAFDTRHYEEHRRLHKSLEHKLNRLKMFSLSDEKVSMESVRKLIDRVERDMLRNTGYAVVVCKYTQDRNDCLSRLYSWRASLRKWTCGLCKDRNCPLFRGRYPINVEPAPEPEDIVWENLSFSRAKRSLIQVVLWGAALSVCFASVYIAAMLIILNINLKNNDFTGTGISFLKPIEDWITSLDVATVQKAIGNPLSADSIASLMLSVLPSMAINVMKTLLRGVFSFLSVKERHTSRTGEQVAFMMRLTITYTITTCLTYIFVLHDARWWFVRGGLIECVAMQLLSFLFSEIGLSLLQVPWLIRVFRRNCLLPLKKGPMSQAAVNQLYEGPDFCTPTKYAAMLQGVCTLFLYVGIAPFLAVQAMLTWAILYWIYKISLLRIVKRPKPEMLGVVQQAVIMLRASILLLAGSTYLLWLTTKGSAAQYLKIYGISAGTLAAISLVVPRSLQLKATYLCLAEARTNTWQAMHYYKLQHVFFSKYHSTQPVYLSWGPERNPDILKEPGSISLMPHGSATRAFEARGAPTRARRRMGALERRGSEDETIDEGRMRRQSTTVPVDGVRIVDGESSRASSLSSDAENSMTDDVVPDPAVVKRLRATLVEGRVAPDFQRLLIERQVQRPWNRLSSARKLATAAAAAKRKKVVLNVEPPDEKARRQKCRQSFTEHSTESSKTPRDARPLGGHRPPCTKEVASEEPHEADSFARFWQWLSSAAVCHLRCLACLTGGGTLWGIYAP